MNHMCCRTSSNKNGSSFAFIKQSKTADKKSCPSNRTVTDSSPSICYAKTHSHVKIKRLRSYRQRNQLRGGAKKASRSNHHHCKHPRSTDITHLHTCCHSSCPCPSRRVAPLPNVVPAAQEPSIITGNRLTGHQGLFNREVKSVDIERLLSRQRHMQQNQQGTPKKKNVSSHPLSVSHIPSPFCINQRSEADEPSQYANRNNDTEKSPDIYKEKVGKGVFKSDMHVTPAQRPRQQLDPPSRSCKGTVSSSHSSLRVAVFKSRRNWSDISKRENLCSVEGTPENPASPISNTQVRRLSPKPVLPPRPQNSEACDSHHRQRESDCISESIKKVAARLCDGLHFPYLRQRNLVAESREVLLKALAKSHGPHLQMSLLQMQQGFDFYSDPASEVRDQEMGSTDTEDFLPAATAATKQHFHTHHGASFGNARSSQSSNSQPQHNLKQLLAHIEPFEAAAGDDFFAPSAPCDWAETTVTTQHWKDQFKRPKMRDDLFSPCENLFFSPSTHHHIHHYLHHNNPFLRYNKSPVQIQSHPTDMANYPPSHMLERDPGHSLFSSPGAEHWSFPPMRLF